MNLPVINIIKYMKEKKQTKKKIGVSSVMKEKFRDMEEKIREARSRRTRKDMVVCSQDQVGKKKFVVKFEDLQE